MQQAVVVIAAHAFEARAAAGVGRGMDQEPWGGWRLYRGELWDLPYAVIRCGPGKVAAAAAAQASIQYLEPRLVVSFGTAGCADTEVRLGTVAAATEVVDVALGELAALPIRIPDRFSPDSRLLGCLCEVPGVVPATLLCWEGHIVSSSQLPPAPNRGGLAIVDWESSAVAQVCEMWDVPWAAVKVVSDHGEVERLRMLAVAAKRPLQWGAEVMRRACFAYLAGADSSKPAVGESRATSDAAARHELESTE